MVVIMMMVMMSLLPRGPRCRRPFRGILIKKWIRWKRECARRLTLILHRNSGFFGCRVRDGNAAHPAELIPFAIVISTDSAHDRYGIGRESLCSVIDGLLRVGFGGQTLG